MKAKEWLLRYKNLNIEINFLRRERKDALEQAFSARPTDEVRIANGGKVSDSYTHSRLEYACKISNLLDMRLQTKQEIELTISEIDDATYRNILFMRYIEFQTLDKIAEKLNYSRRQVERLHGKALLIIQSLIDKENMS